MSSAIKLILVTIVIGVVAGVFFVIRQGGPTGGDGGLQVASESARGLFGGVATRTSEVDSQEILALFSEVSSIAIDTTIFSERAFTSLQDISVLLEQPPVVGRPNPFLPIGITPIDESPASLPVFDDNGFDTVDFDEGAAETEAGV